MIFILFSIHIWWSRSKENAEPILVSDIQRGTAFAIASTLFFIIASWGHVNIIGLLAILGGTVILAVTLLVSKRVDD